MTTPTLTEINQVHVKINGAAIDPSVAVQLIAAEVDDSLYLPSMATLQFNDPPDTNGNVAPFLNANTVAIGAEIEIGFSGSSSPIFKGEITSVEPDFNLDGFNQLTVRAYDKGHRLIRVRKTRTFLQVSDSDVMSTIAGEAGLQATIASTTVVHDYLIQNNQTNYEFLQERAARIGHIIRTALGKFISQPLASYSTDAATLNFGNQLLEFRPRLTAASQPDSVEVRGWDVHQKAAVVATGVAATPSASIGAKRGQSLASPFGASQAFGSNTVPSMQTSEAEKYADALINVARNGDIQAEGVAHGNPAIVAGTKITIAGLGTLFNGKYLVTRARHSYTNDRGYIVAFESTNGTGETTAALVASDHAALGVSGAVIGIVTDNNDSEGNLGRVKVKFPWMLQNNGQDIVSDWARIASPMAGKGRGFMFLPEVNDEVLVAFEHGDLRRPYVIGMLWNGQDAPPLAAGAAVADGKVTQRVIKTTSGHIVTFDDSDSSPLISIIDKTGSNKITIDSKANTISVEADGDITVKSAKKVNIEATSDISLTGKANIKIDSAAEMSLTAKAGIKMDGGAQVEIKGGMVKIN